MPINVNGGTASEKARVRDAANEVLIKLWRVTSGWLRTCIKTQATRGTVIIENCDDPTVLGYNSWTVIFGYKISAEDEENIKELLVEIGARGSEDGQDMWGLKSINPFKNRQ